MPRCHLEHETLKAYIGVHRRASAFSKPFASMTPVPKKVHLAPVFAEGGALERAVPGLRQRPQQLEFVDAVLQAIESSGVLIAEAGTGTGKTFAYLVPALM